MNNVCCCYLILLYVLSRSLSKRKFRRPSNMALFTLLSHLSLKKCFKIHTSIVFEHLNFLKFSSSSSFGRQLSQKCGIAGSENYERTHITEPPASYQFGLKELNTLNSYLRVIKVYESSKYVVIFASNHAIPFVQMQKIAVLKC